MEYSSLFPFIFLYTRYSVAIIDILNLGSLQKASIYKYDINMFLRCFIYIRINDDELMH